MLRVGESAYKTDTGRQRRANEDSYFARAPVFAVADGMGGAQAGEVASRVAASSFESGFPTGDPPEKDLEKLFGQANDEIHLLAGEDATKAGMGTTLTAALVGGTQVSFGHVGDSRAYLLRDGTLRQLTSDHSLVEELRRQGRISEEEAAEHPQRSVITRALGPEPSVKVDTFTEQAHDGDVFLLCSDGLTTMLAESKISEILIESKTLRSAVSRLVDAANKAGGKDNITAVAFRLEDAGEDVEEGVTLIARTAGQAGLTADKVREAADRIKGDSPMPAPRSRRYAVRAAVIALCLGLLILLGFLLGRQVYFVGTDDQGRVALFRGVPYELPLGLDLYSEQYSIGVQASSLAPARRLVIIDHRLRSKEDATDLINDIDANEGTTPPPADRGKPSKDAKEGSGKETRGGQSK